MKKTALITGITGQDGYFLSKLLLEKGYRVVGLIPPERSGSLTKLNDLIDRIETYSSDLRDSEALQQAVSQLEPTEIYNLVAPSFVPDSWKDPLGTLDLITGTATRLLTAIQKVGLPTRFYQASSSEIFGSVQESPQSEQTPFRPKNPYGAAKLHAHWTMTHHRDQYGLFACSGILFNHESERRPPQFVTRKVTLAAASIKLGLTDRLSMGNLQAKRDWGYAGDYVRAMWQMLQADTPQDFVIGTGRLHKVQDLVEVAFNCVDLDWKKYVEINPKFLRRDEHLQLVANPHKANSKLGWSAEISFEQMISNMVQHDLKQLKHGKLVPVQ